MKARDNPFASHRIEALPFCFSTGDSWEALLTRLAAQSWRGSIAGPHGTGKSTVLDQLAPHLSARGFHPRLFRLSGEITADGKRQLLEAARSLRAPEFLLIDGAEQLTTREWLGVHAAAAGGAGCVITLPRAARLPVILETAPSPALLDALAEQLSPGSLPTGTAGALFVRHRGNLRECLRELYNREAGLSDRRRE
ncbi:MAG: hypothetical protein ABIZ56_09895 [Chthoniobacteraceae bacterium]